MLGRAAPPREPGKSRTGLAAELVELLVFLAQIVPALVLSSLGGDGGHASFARTAASIIARDVALVGLVVVFVWRSGEGTVSLGWRKPHVMREIEIGAMLFIPVAVAVAAFERMLRSLGVPEGPTSLPAALHPEGAAQIALATGLVLVVAIAEETIFRGYLILRFGHLTRNRAVAVLLSSAIFAAGHAYEGAMGVLAIGFMGILLALLYLWRESLVASIVIHFLQDVLSIVIVPLVGHLS